MYTMTDREIDVLVAERVMGFQRPQLIMTVSGDMDWSYNADTPPRAVGQGGYMKYVDRYSTCGGGMLVVIDKMEALGYNGVLYSGSAAIFVSKTKAHSMRDMDNALSKADTLPMAVCLAALKAMGEGV